MQLTSGAISNNQIKKHINILKQILNFISWKECICFTEELASARNWRASTKETYFGSMRGAVKRADIYGIPIKLISSPGDAILISDFQKKISFQKISEMADTKQALPICKLNVYKLLAFQITNDLKVYFILMWVTASRPGCAAKINPERIKFDKCSGEIRVMFVEGKTVRFLGQPYAVLSVVDDNRWKDLVSGWIKMKLPFREDIQKLALKWLKTLNKEYELRSFRRGAAIHLSKNGATVEQIMKFTMHTSASTCRRYLSFGWDETISKELSALGKTLS